MEAKCTTRHTLCTLCPHHSVAYYVRNSMRTHYIRTYADAYTYIHTYIHTYHSGPSVGCDPKLPRFVCSGWAVTLPVTTQARWWLRALEMSILKHAAGMRSLDQEFRRRKGAVSWLFRRIPSPIHSRSSQCSILAWRGCLISGFNVWKRDSSNNTKKKNNPLSVFR